MKVRCPKCGSESINQLRQLTGPIWCNDCGFRVENKEINNPFIFIAKVSGAKTRARQIAEEIDAALEAPRYTPRIEVIEKLLNKYAEELEGKE